MDLFWKKLFGGIMSTSKFEKQLLQIQKDMQRYAKVEQSAELAEYKKLTQVVNASDFKEKKKTLETKKYKDTDVYQDYKKFQTLQNKSDLLLYYKTLESKELKDFLEFKNTPEYLQLTDKQKVKDSEKLKRHKKFDQSKAYKTYSKLHASSTIKDYEKLKEKISSPRFQQENTFWSDKNRWQKTPEYQDEYRFMELSKNPDIIFYLKEAKPERFNSFISSANTFDEEFDGNVLSKSNWDFGFHYNNPALIGEHSYANEKQAYNSGKNVSVTNGELKISTKKEKIKARAWDTAKGFIEKEFEYTSDIIQSAKKIRQQYGIFQAKIRCEGKINHAFWLGCDSKLPVIEIFHFDGKSIRVGTISKSGKNENYIKGIKPSDYYIYTLIWNEKELIWSINDLIIHKSSNHIPHEKMYLAFNSFISETQTAQEGYLQVDWVRVYANT